MAVHDDARPNAPCRVCGVQAETRCDWGYDPIHGLPCYQPLCWACAVVTINDDGGADIWCPAHAQTAAPPVG